MLSSFVIVDLQLSFGIFLERKIKEYFFAHRGHKALPVGYET